MMRPVLLALPVRHYSACGKTGWQMVVQRGLNEASLAWLRSGDRVRLGKSVDKEREESLVGEFELLQVKVFGLVEDPAS